MKFVYHNLKMLMNRTRYNGWVLGELFVVFIVLWFLCDSIGCFTYTLTRPLGFDYSHVYELQLDAGGEERDTTHSYIEKVLMVRDRLRRMDKVVEAVGLHYSSDPMGASNRWSAFFCNDSTSVSVRYAMMDNDMMKVFRFHPESGQPDFASMPVSDSYGMVTRMLIHWMQKRNPAFTKDSILRTGKDDERGIRIYSVLEDFRPGRFEKSQGWFIKRIDDNLITTINMPFTVTIRVLPEADRSDFSAYFLKEIAPAIEVDNVMVMNLVPYEKIVDCHESADGSRDRLQTHSFVALFLLVNVFMGVVGTFWYRTRRRRSEIALRMSVGSCRRQVRRLLLGEGLILLTVVAIPATIVCLNVALMEPSVGNSPLIAVWPVEWSTFRFVAGISVTWLLMALMIVFGIWMPATQAMKIQPAEALHEE